MVEVGERILRIKTDRTEFEQLQLQYISFLSEVVGKPLLGYIELRNYANIN